MQNNPPLLPLEQYFMEVAKQPEKFPTQKDYWKHYSSMLQILREEFYPNVNVGLAANSGADPAIYTDHSGEHFDEVVRYAGFLLAFDPNSEEFPKKIDHSPFEIFLLLMAIRLHDVGNIYGRDGHERKAIDVYKESVPPASRDPLVSNTIFRIAQAHGGKSSRQDKDTIADLQETDHLGSNIRFKPRAIAALVRFADEICEHRGRVKMHMIDSGVIPEHNLIYHLYGASIKSSVVNRSDKSVSIDYVVHQKYLRQSYPVEPPKANGRPQKKKFLIDEILDRIGKLNLERIYCNQYLEPQYQTDRIHIKIYIVDGEHGEKTLEEKKLNILPGGYPTDNKQWRGQLVDFDGKSIKKRHGKLPRKARVK